MVSTSPSHSSPFPLIPTSSQPPENNCPHIRRLLPNLHPLHHLGNPRTAQLTHRRPRNLRRLHRELQSGGLPIRPHAEALGRECRRNVSQRHGSRKTHDRAEALRQHDLHREYEREYRERAAAAGTVQCFESRC